MKPLWMLQAAWDEALLTAWEKGFRINQLLGWYWEHILKLPRTHSFKEMIETFQNLGLKRCPLEYIPDSKMSLQASRFIASHAPELSSALFDNFEHVRSVNLDAYPWHKTPKKEKMGVGAQQASIRRSEGVYRYSSKHRGFRAGDGKIKPAPGRK